eukprot:TRINITY_DN34176_c0_g1_i2.p1 TRINITY_DN34176_c0_g1~~TRINITY_DN34176_c0_g1_i2.p1  ORF type:complete len:378 (-),score=83.88 TRINITY_DN34176_c0_g1_i2:152-1285(-)
MAFSWLACCTTRDGHGLETRCIPVLAKCIEEEDDDLEFFDCVDCPRKLAALQKLECSTNDDESPKRRVLSLTYLLRTLRRRRRKLAGYKDEDEDEQEGDHTARAACDHVDRQLARECGDPIAIGVVLDKTRAVWKQRLEEMREDMKLDTELKWVTPSTAHRMLKANMDKTQEAAAMFVAALDIRSRYRQLFETMKHDNLMDLRVFRRDTSQRPVIYGCMRNQTASLGACMNQVMATFETACRLAGEHGTVNFIMDVHGLQPSLNCDSSAMKEMSDILGTVFAERASRVIIVDFSRCAQFLWYLLRPMLRPATREKFSFVSKDQALELARDLFDAEGLRSLRETFEINRDPKATIEQRMAHADKTKLEQAETFLDTRS